MTLKENTKKFALPMGKSKIGKKSKESKDGLKKVKKNKKLDNEFVINVKEKEGGMEKGRRIKNIDNDAIVYLKEKKKNKCIVNNNVIGPLEVSHETDNLDNSESIKKKIKKIKKVKKIITDIPDEKNEDMKETPKKKKKRKASDELLDSDGSATEDVPQKKRKKMKKDSETKTQNEDPELKARTIFIGNVPIKCTKKTIKKHFRKYGIIESIRIRGIPVANPSLSKKVAIIKQEYHPNRNNCLCYIRYLNPEDAVKAQAENGVLFEGHHLRVHSCAMNTNPDETKAIFIGNLNFDASEDELWKLFEVCGPISYVRIIRDAYTGMGKGFAYVNFIDSDAVQLALEMEDVKLKDRVLRISLCNSSVAKRNKKMKTQKQITKPGQQQFRKSFNNRNKFGSEESDSNKFKKNRKEGFSKIGNKSFQGSKFTDKKKKFKKDKRLAERKKKIDMIAPKSE